MDCRWTRYPGDQRFGGVRRQLLERGNAPLPRGGHAAVMQDDVQRARAGRVQDSGVVSTQERRRWRVLNAEQQQEAARKFEAFKILLFVGNFCIACCIRELVCRDL